MPKQKMYDEWAAVIKHQDEVALNIKEQETMAQKEQKIIYGEQLANQINEQKEIKLRKESEKKSSIEDEKKRQEDMIKVNKYY
jgi:hypothetical protein